MFKGGTCLRKCYFETYRFSEDLDFNVVGGGPEEPADFLPVFRRVGEWLFDRSGIEIVLDEQSLMVTRWLLSTRTGRGAVSMA